MKKKDEIESDDEVVVVVDERVVVVVVDEIELRKMDFEEIDGESEVFFRDFEMVFFLKKKKSLSTDQTEDQNC